MGNSGAGVLIYVADTGLLKGADHKHPWLRGVRRGRRPDGALQHWEADREMWQGEKVIPPYAGHGTFVAGVVRSMAPQSDVIVSNVFRVAGSALESHFVRELVRALKLGVDLFHLSITAPTRWDLPLLAFEGWLKLLGQYKGTACIVAAGNNGSRHPFWPAAFPEVLSVGALALTFVTGLTSAITVAGWTYTHRAGTWSTRTPWHLCVPRRSLQGPEEAVLWHGPVERDVLLDPGRDRPHRCPDVAHR